MRLCFHTRYFIITISLLLIEAAIALYVHDDIIRPYIGDFLVVVLLYCFIKTFLSASVLSVASGVLLFSFLIEWGQYFHLISLLGLENSTLAKVILGNSFAWVDILMYMAGTTCVIFIEAIRRRHGQSGSM